MKIFEWDGLLATDFGNGSGASFLGVGIYGKKNKTWWHKALIKPMWRVGNKMHGIKLWFMYRFVKEHKYHIIDTKLEPHYYDIDHVMLHGMFALLDRYIEDECGGIDKVEQWGKSLIEDDPNHFMHENNVAQGEKELSAAQLYRWWHEKRPADMKRERELLHILYNRNNNKPYNAEELYKERNDLEDKIAREEQEMLHRLIDIRRGLWT